MALILGFAGCFWLEIFSFSISNSLKLSTSLIYFFFRVSWVIVYVHAWLWFILLWGWATVWEGLHHCWTRDWSASWWSTSGLCTLASQNSLVPQERSLVLFRWVTSSWLLGFPFYLRVPVCCTSFEWSSWIWSLLCSITLEEWAKTWWWRLSDRRRRCWQRFPFVFLECDQTL